LTIDSSLDEIALIKRISGATIQNLSLSAFNITGNDFVGSLVATVTGSSNYISNIHINQSHISGSVIVGGVVGQIIASSTIVTNITNQALVVGSTEIGGVIGLIEDSESVTAHALTNLGNVSSSSIIIGGIIGYISQSNNISVIDTHNEGNIISKRDQIGGIIGYIFRLNGGVVSNSINNGTISGIGSSSDEVGGIVGYIRQSQIQLNNLTNTGIVNGSDNQIGGIIGYIDDNNVITLSSITNTGDVTGDDEVGGIVGYIRRNSKVTLSEITNTGDVTGDDEVGGIVGYIRRNSKVTLSEITNTGDVTGNEDRIGGIIGYIEELSNVTLTSITNSGDVTGKNEVGGIVGQINQTSSAILSEITNTGDVTGADDQIGGIIGRVEENSNVTLSSVTNSGDITSTGTSGDEVAGIIGRIEGSTVHMTNAVNHGTIEGQTEVGGLVGDITGGSHVNIIRSMNYGSVTSLDDIGSNSQVGGLVGDGSDDSTDYLRIFQSANFGTVSGHLQGIGGLIGEINRGSVEIIESFNEGEVHLAILNSNQGIAGGIVGYIFHNNSNVTLSSVYNSGLISASSVNTGDTVIGGLIGRVGDDPEVSIIHAYNVGLTTSSANDYEMGAVMGSNDSNNIALTSVFYLDSIASGISFGAITGTIAGTALTQTAVQLVDVNTFFNESWSITSHGIGEGSAWVSGYNGINTYPWLQWRNGPSNDQVSNIYFIRTPQDLKAIENDLDGNYIILNDIDLSSYGTLNRSFIDATFKGNLSGQGFTIENLAISATEDNIGLFKHLGTNANIENFKIDNFAITGTAERSSTGFIVGSVSNATNIRIATIVLTNSSLKNVRNSGSIIGSITNSDVELSGIHNSSTLDVSHWSGGIIGSIATRVNLTLNNITNSGSYTHSGERNGGIIGRIDLNSANSNITISSVTNNMNITSSGTHIGGVVGSIIVVAGSLRVSLSQTTNNGDIYSSNGNDAHGHGGIFGTISTGANSFILTGAAITNNGAITRNAAKGHIIGNYITTSDDVIDLINISYLNVNDYNLIGIRNDTGDLYPHQQPPITVINFDN
jgi:uncharacterized membrane protein (UPF0136 family)